MHTFCSFIIILCLLSKIQAESLKLCDSYDGVLLDEEASTTAGNAWVGCANGQIRVLGCLRDDGAPIALGDGIQRDGYELTCVETSDNGVHLRATACIYDGVQYIAGQTIPANGLWYACTETPTGVSITTVSCSDDQMRQVKPGSHVIRGDYQYTCTQHDDKSISLQPTGCISGDVVYGVGSDFAKSKFIFECVIESDKSISMRMKSCALPDGSPMSIGQKYYKTDGFIIQCIENIEGTIVQEVVGCVQNKNGTDQKIDPGCYRQVLNEVAICNTKKARLQVTVMNNTPEYRAQLDDAGFREC